MDKYISVLGVLIAIMLILFFVVAKFIGVSSVSPSFGSCDRIEDEKQRVICLRELAFKNLDIMPCLQIEGQLERDVCLRNVAVKSGDRTLCLQISSSDIRRICLEGT
jgi:hypothetical protein